MPLAISNLSLGNLIVEKWLDSLGESHVPISPLPESKQESTASGGSGLPSGISQPSYEWTGSRWRTYQGLFPDEDLPPLTMILPKHGGLRNGCIFARPKWAPVMKETESSSWQTPRANESQGGEYQNQRDGSTLLTLTGEAQNWGTPRVTTNAGIPSPQCTGKGSRLEDQAGLWATPTAAMTTGAGTEGREGGENLQTQANSWPTPMGRDGRDGRDGRASEATREKNSRPLNEIACLFSLQDQTTNDGQQFSESSRTSRQLSEKKRLNSCFVAWLMNMPHPFWLVAAPISFGREATVVALANLRSRMRNYFGG